MTCGNAFWFNGLTMDTVYTVLFGGVLMVGVGTFLRKVLSWGNHNVQLIKLVVGCCG